MSTELCAISHIEVFTIERGPLLAIAAGYEYASKRLRRWAIFAALRAYMIAKRVDARSSGVVPADRPATTHSAAV